MTTELVQTRIEFQLSSTVESVYVTAPGHSYSIGDIVPLEGGSGTGATAVVSEVYEGGVTVVKIRDQGAGYLPNAYFDVTPAVGDAGSGANVRLIEVHSTGRFHANTFVPLTELLANVSSVVMNVANYRVSAPDSFIKLATANANTRMMDACNSYSYGPCGPMKRITVDVAGSKYGAMPTVTMPSPEIPTLNSNNYPISDLGILGTIEIVNSGTGYELNDKVEFKLGIGGRGCGATALVSSVSSSGAILGVEMQPPVIGGTVSVNTGVSANTVNGVDTHFLVELKVGDRIRILREDNTVKSITSNTVLVTDNNWSTSITSANLSLWGKDFIGGSGYKIERLPTISIISNSGANAELAVTTLIGTGGTADSSSLNPLGGVKKISVTNGGSNYLTAPNVDLSMIGSGTAKAIAVVGGGIKTYPGRFEDQSGFVSGLDRMQGFDFYQFFSYVIKGGRTLDEYRKVLELILHPVGYKYFGEWQSDTVHTTLSVGTSDGCVGNSNNIVLVAS